MTSTATPALLAQGRGRAMGSSVHLMAVGDASVVGEVFERAFAMIEALEVAWSRFRPGSEVSCLNAAIPGTPVPVSLETIWLVQRGIEAWSRTGGLFDPSMLRAIVAAGYDRDFDSLTMPMITIPGPAIDGSCGDIIVDPIAQTVSLPEGVGFDPGGLGKGLTADLVAEAALAWGVDGMLVNMGGDLRCAGTPPPSGSWIVELPGPDGGLGRTVRLVNGAVATSTCLRRQWKTLTGHAHHLIDPRTAKPATSAADAVTVVAASACDAETLATAIAANGRLPLDRTMFGDAAVLVTERDGTQQRHGLIDRYLQ